MVKTDIVEAGATGVMMYAYSDTSDSPVAITTTSPELHDKMVNVRGITGGLGLTVTQSSNTGTTPPSWWPLPDTTTGTTKTDVDVILTNPHGDVISSAPATSGTGPGDLSGAAIYEPFGTPIQESGVDIYGWEGTAQRSSFNIGRLISMGARLYNPATGRFLTTDPIPGGNPNPYTYPTDPINSQDLDGLNDENSYTYEISLFSSAKASAARVNRYLKNKFGKIFPWGSNCGKIVAGAQCSLGFPKMNWLKINRVKVVRQDKTGFVLESMFPHAEGTGRKIDFHAYERGGRTHLWIRSWGPRTNAQWAGWPFDSINNDLVVKTWSRLSRAIMRRFR